MRRALKKNETMKLGKVFLGSSPGLLKKFHRNWLKANWRHFVCKAKLYIPSTLNIDLILWHTQLIVFTVKC